MWAEKSPESEVAIVCVFFCSHMSRVFWGLWFRFCELMWPEPFWVLRGIFDFRFSFGCYRVDDRMQVVCKRFSTGCEWCVHVCLEQCLQRAVSKSAEDNRPAARLMEYHLLCEAENNLCTWFARAPTEANISDHPSRNMLQALLELKLDESAAASIWFDSLANTLKLGQAERSGEYRQPGPTWQKRSFATAFNTCGQCMRPHDAVDLDHQVVLTIVLRNSQILGRMQFHPRLLNQGRVRWERCKINPKAPTHNHPFWIFHGPNP